MRRLLTLPARAVPGGTALRIGVTAVLIVLPTVWIFLALPKRDLDLEISCAAIGVVALWLLAALLYQVGRAGREIARSARRFAEGDVTVECGVTLADEYGEIGTHLNAAVTRMREVLQVTDSSMKTIQGRSSEFEDSASQSMDTAQETSRRAEAVSGASQLVLARATAIDGTLDELIASIRDIAESAARASSVANRASDMAAEADEGIVRLEKSSAEVGHIVALIASIADRTNLLALNAAIEAARVGEVGHGFSVVSEEVRSLAEKTLQAAEDVGSLISGVVEEMGSARVSVTRAREIVDEISEIQTVIAAAVEEQAAVAAEVGRTMTETTSANAAASTEVGAVAQLAAYAAEGAGRIHSAADVLSRNTVIVRDLTRELLGSFVLAQENGNGDGTRHWTGSVQIIRSDLDSSAPPVSVPVTAETTVDAFLDSVYLAVKDYVRLYTYNRAWVLADQSHKELEAMGTRWARANGRSRDDRRISEVGVTAGSVLRAARKRS